MSKQVVVHPYTTTLFSNTILKHYLRMNTIPKHYLRIKKNRHATTWMTLKIIMLSERSQTHPYQKEYIMGHSIFVKLLEIQNSL